MATDRERGQQAGERLPPQAPDVERTVLGSMLLDGNAVALAMEKLDDQVFYLSAHRHIFTCMVELFSKDTPVDIVTLADALRKRGLLDAVGSEAYLSELVENVATSANIEYYAEILREKATLRRLITAASEIATDAFAAEAEADAILDSSERRIFSIKESRIRKGVIRIGDLLPTTFKEIEDYSRGGVMGIPTGFKKLDEMTTGLQKGDLIILAGRPSMGKTACALSIALNAGVRAGKAIAVFSLEMSQQQVAQRMLCSEARVNMHRLRSGTLPKGDFPKLSLAAGPLHDAPIYVDDTPGISVLEIRAKSRRLKAQGHLDLVIVDYLQLMSSTMRVESRQQEISQISRSLKGLAKELEVPVMTLSQLSRAVEQRGGDHRPQLSDLRESGAIEQDADVVLFMFRPGYYDRENPEVQRTAEVIVGKQRNGPTGTVELVFMQDYVRFENAEMHQETGL